MPSIRPSPSKPTSSAVKSWRLPVMSMSSSRSADLGRAPGLRGDQRAGGKRRLRLLAAEPAAHPADLDRHVGALEAEQGRDQVLDLARMLGRADDVELARLARRGERGLAFEVEMPCPPIWSVPARRCGASSAACASPRAIRCTGSKSAFPPPRLGDGDEGGERLGFGLRQPRARRAARLLVAATTNSGWPG